MEIIEARTVTQTDIVSHNMVFSAEAEWDVNTTYAEDARIYLGLTEYQSLQGGNTGNNPTDAESVWWIKVGSVNMWRPFDASLEVQASNPETISYTFDFDDFVDAIGVFSSEGTKIEVVVKNEVGDTVHTATKSLIQIKDSAYQEWGYYFFAASTISFALVTGLPARPGDTITVTIYAEGDMAKVGEILIGNNHVLGETLVDTEPSSEDFSIKERNDFGVMKIVERGFIDRVDFRFVFSTEDVKMIKRVLNRNRAKLAVYHGGEAVNEEYGLVIPGFFNSYSLPLGVKVSTGSLSAESLLSNTEIV